MNQKCTCQECGWAGTFDDLLCGDNPFVEHQNIYACPKCKELSNTIVSACDEVGCYEEVMGGMKTADGGYVNLCQKHYVLYSQRGKLKK